MGRSRCNCRYFSLVHDISYDGPMRLEDERLEYKIIFLKKNSGGNDAGLYSHGWSLMKKSEDRPPLEDHRRYRRYVLFGG